MNRFVIYAILIAMAIYFIVKKYRSVHIHGNSILCFTGALGSGKTFMAVTYAKSLYRQQAFFWRIGLRKDKPYLISNIPIRLSKNTWAHVLKREHLLMSERIPEKAIVLIDELGGIASQYSYDNPNVMVKLADLVRFFRQYINGRFIFTDQTLSDVIFTIRRRTIINYCLSNFSKGNIFPTYKINCDVVKVIGGEDGGVINTNALDRSQKQDYFYGMLPFWRRYRDYDTRCYSDNYKPENDFDSDLMWRDYKTDYLIDLSATNDEKKEFRKSRGKNIEEVEKPKIDLDNYVI